MPRRILPCRSSLPRPLPGSPMLFETTVRSVASESSASASIRVSGAPTRPKPPTMTVSPVLTWLTASSAEMTVLTLTAADATRVRADSSTGIRSAILPKVKRPKVNQPVQRLADPYSDLDVIDSRAPRFNQAVIGVLSAGAVAFGWWWLLALLAAQLAIGLTFGRRYCL